MFLRVKRFFKDYFLFILILGIASFLRFYRIEELTTFLGEQGRDLLIARSILVDKKLTLLGPPTSLSPYIHFGPFYHYFNAFWLFLFNFNPLGPAIGFGVLGVLGCLGLYFSCQKLGFKKAGIFSSFLFAVSPLMVEYGRSMFNSYLIVSFSIFSFWVLSIFLKEEKWYFLFLSGTFAALSFQANFLSWGIILGTLVFIMILRKKIFQRILIFLAGVFFGISPYIAFEIRHEFFNTKGFFSLLRKGQAVSFSFWKFILGLEEVVIRSFFYSVGIKDFILTLCLIAFSFILVIFLFRKKQEDNFLKALVVFLLAGILSVRFYSGEMLDHYLGSIYPFIFLLLGYLFEKSFSFRFNFLITGFLILVGILNFLSVDVKRNHGYGMILGWNMKYVKKTAQVIAADAKGEFNVAAILDGDTRAYPYRYLLEVAGKHPLGVEDYPKSRILYVVGKGEKESILSYPVWEIYSFLPAKVTKIWTIKDEIKIFKLEKI